jgi:hypothetical protein
MNGRREISEHDADKTDSDNRGHSRADGATSGPEAATYSRISTALRLHVPCHPCIYLRSSTERHASRGVAVVTVSSIMSYQSTDSESESLRLASQSRLT